MNSPAGPPWVHVQYRDGSHLLISARELHRRSTGKATAILLDVHQDRAWLNCCGKRLKVNSRGNVLYASALPGERHPCGIFGRGAHPRRIRVPSIAAGEPIARDDLRVDLELGLDAPIRPLEPDLEFPEGAGIRPRQISLAALITELLYRARMDRYEPDAEATLECHLALVKGVVGGLMVNGHSARHVVFVSVPGEAAEQFAAFAAGCGSGLASQQGAPVAIVIGEVLNYRTAQPATIELSGPCAPLELSDRIAEDAARRYPYAFLRLKDRRGARVLIAASVALETAARLRPIGLGLLLASDRYMPADSHLESQMSNELVRLHIHHEKPRNSGGATEVPDFRVGETVLEVVGRKDPRYITSLLRKLQRYAAAGKRVVLWLAAFGEKISSAIQRLMKLLYR